MELIWKTKLYFQKQAINLT